MIAEFGPGQLAAARQVVQTHLTPTPLIALDGFPDVRLKLETLQPTGSFKVRGAFAALAAHGPAGEPVVTASAGNHGLGIAHAAATLGRRATVVVAADASPAKIAALRGYPIDLIIEGQGFDEAERIALGLPGPYISAYTDPWVICGQASLLTEILSDVDDPVTVVVPLGGGGLLAGTVLAAEGHDVHVVGVESAASRAVSTAIARGAVVEVPIGPTLADGLAGNIEPAALTPGLIAGRADLCAVEEEAIAEAVRYLYRRAGLVVEGSGAVGLAAVMSGLVPRDRPLILPLTGRNIAPDRYASLLAA